MFKVNKLSRLAMLCSALAAPTLAFALVDPPKTQGPAALAASLMAQFYDVPVDAISVVVHSDGPRTAVVYAKDQNGNECSFDTALAPPEANAPTGWVVASTRCRDYLVRDTSDESKKP